MAKGSAMSSAIEFPLDDDLVFDVCVVRARWVSNAKLGARAPGHVELTLLCHHCGTETMLAFGHGSAWLLWGRLRRFLKKHTHHSADAGWAESSG